MYSSLLNKQANGLIVVILVKTSLHSFIASKQASQWINSCNTGKRIPVQRSTLYTLIKIFGIETFDSESGLDKADPKEFGSYRELIKLDKFKFKNPAKT
jgi:hypothetical protein